MKKILQVKEVSSGLTNRRSFLKISGLAMAGTGLLLAGCSDDDDNGMIDNSNQMPGMRNGVFDLGGGDIGIITYAYALEQLEADFYTRVVNGSTFTSIFNADEQAVLVDLYNHEVIHREVLKQAINTKVNNNQQQVLPNLNFDYGSLNFGDRNKVLDVARMLEDTGVAAYNGAGKYLKDADNLTLAGKIVSVEARHASVIRSLINPNDAFFANNDVVDPTTGKSQAKEPTQVLNEVRQMNYITTNFTSNYL
jgi:rubrerythrin